MIPHQISLEEAIDLTTRYRKNPGIDMFLSETFDAASVIALLTQPGCKFFRIYYGKKEDNSIHAVLVGADTKEHDILPSSQSNKLGEDDGIILEDAFHCPQACPPPSPLNGD